MASQSDPIFLYSDFGLAGPYVGQMEAAVLRVLPQARVVALMSDAPSARPRPSAYLLNALLPYLPDEAGVVAVVDPGVGTARRPLCMHADNRWLVGPDNGLLARAARSARRLSVWRLDWEPEALSVSFHGRDLFAPACARLLAGDELPRSPLAPADMCGWDWPEQLAELIYFDHYGNAFTGLDAAAVGDRATLRCRGIEVRPARVFAESSAGEPFWYLNSCGLVEIAVDRDSAAERLGLAIGDPIEVVPG